MFRGTWLCSCESPTERKQPKGKGRDQVMVSGKLEVEVHASGKFEVEEVVADVGTVISLSP